MTLDWPSPFPRTPSGEREPYPNGFEVSQTQAFRSLWEELRRLNARNPVVETAAPHTQTELWRPYEDRTPEDPGVVARWEDETGRGYATPCDRWSTLQDNARAIAKYLDAKRGIDRWGVATIEGEFSTQALPSGDAVAAAEPLHDVLGVAPDPPPEVVGGAYRSLVKTAHPDAGGSREAFERLQNAKEAMLDE